MGDPQKSIRTSWGWQPGSGRRVVIGRLTDGPLRAKWDTESLEAVRLCVEVNPGWMEALLLRNAGALACSDSGWEATSTEATGIVAGRSGLAGSAQEAGEKQKQPPLLSRSHQNGSPPAIGTQMSKDYLK